MTKKIHLALLLYTLLLCTGLAAQSVQRIAIASNSFTSTTMRYTVGQSVSASALADAGYTALGFHQPVPFFLSLSVTPNSTICRGTSITLNAVAAGATSISWSTGATTAAISVRPDSTTKYYVTVSDGSTTLRDSVTVTVIRTRALFTVNNNAQCLRDNRFVFTNQSSANTGSLNYSWDFGDSVVSSAFSPATSYALAGTYNVRLIAINNTLGCRDTMTQSMTVYPPPTPATISFAGDTVCTSTSLLLRAGTNYRGYQWYLNGGLLIGANDSTLNATRSGDYTVVITSAEGCRSDESAIARVTLNKLPAAPVAPSAFYCVGGTPAPMTATALPGHTLLWYTAATGGTGSSTAPTPRTDSVFIQDYFVSQTSPQGCEGPRARVSALVFGAPVRPTITWNGAELSVSQGYSSYQWILSNSALTGANQYFYRPLSAGNYRVRVTNAGGCADTSLVYNLLVTGLTTITPELGTVQIFPNPASDQIMLEFSKTPVSDMRVRLLSNDGRPVKSLVTRQKQQWIPIATLPAGMYYVEVGNGKHKAVLKILKF